MVNTSLIYIEKDGAYLMMHRVKKQNDVNKDKWIGVGGHFEDNEGPYDCARREALEETGLTLGPSLKLRAVVTFIIEDGECNHMFLFTCSDFTGELKSSADCREGTLEWVPKSKIYDLDLWEGDLIFLRKIESECDFFTLKLIYDKDGNLIGSEMD